MEAKFSDIRQAYEIDKKSPLIFRAMPKIKDTYMAPIMRFAMKVNIAAQVMSRTVAAFLYTLQKNTSFNREIEQRSLATATFIQQVDELFDSFNGSQITPPTGKDIKCLVTDDSAHQSYWKKAFQIIKKWKFKRFTKQGNLRTTKPPSQIGWLTSIRAIQYIWNDLRSKGFSSLRPRALNQDALENLFGAIRSGCGDNPTVFQFIGSLKTQILNGLTKQALSGTNCEEDDNVLLSNLKSFLHVEETHTDSDAETGGNEETLSVAYVSGFIAKKILGPDHQCDDCQQLLCSTSMEAQNLFIAFKEWTDNENRLMYPSENLVIAVGHAVTVLENFIQKHGGKPDLSKCSAIEIKNVVNFSWFSCELHCNTIIEGVIKAVCPIGIPWWCKRQNRNIIQEKKDARATKRKIRKFKNQ
ncbi:hypothetical protein NQ315_006594 [Exocentrus adspersus]|uniref:Transposable element P transposase n=1 Tax=Exocentrus adspersus TaxID=1586481 RepID=A0AAV8VG78_9CUCU|nr:hypothetical protein NQ315_006594 [Exocentrus adspersus]